MDLGQLDLNLLYTFRAVIDAGGVGAAARLLLRTQPAVSARLRQLEESLGVRLFERVGRRLDLTAVGRAVAGEVRDVLRGVHGLVDRVRESAATPVGALRVGALPTVSAYLLAPRLAGYARAFPQVTVELRLGLSPPQLEDLLDGKLDAVVSVGPPPDDRRLDVVRLGVAVAVAVLPRRAAGGRLTLRRLTGLELVGFGPVGDPFFDAVWAFLVRHGLDRGIRLRVPNIQTLKALVSAGAGVTILPDYTVVEPDLATRRVPGLEVAHAIWLAVRRTTRDVPAVAAFRQAVLARR